MKKTAPEEIRNIQSKSKKQENGAVANKASNNQKQETKRNRKRKEKVEQPKFSDSEQGCGSEFLSVGVRFLLQGIYILTTSSRIM